jgi:hypothetical protein
MHNQEAGRMRLKSGKGIALLLSLMLAVPIFWLTSTTTTVSAAATPTFKKSKVEITGIGNTYTLVINNKVKGSKYKYTTSKKSVAKVSSKGVVTSVGAGTTTISCKITYPTKKTKTITCKVTVRVPASFIEIANGNTNVNNSHVMTVNSTYDFDYTLTPLNSTDKAYWYVGEGDSIVVENSADGIVKAVKPGFATLMVKAVKSASNSNVSSSIEDDAIIIEVREPKADIKSADITSSNNITVVFDSPVDKSTVIDSNGRLTNNIVVGLGKDSKNVTASDYGTLTASLSTDGLTLTITASKAFAGIYTINFTNGIKTTTGIAMGEWSKTLNYVDNTPPIIQTVELDDTGFVNKITFSEAIDVTNFKVSNAQVSSGTAAESSSISIINNKLNYVLSTDKKVLTLNLSGISSSDYNKTFTVILSGIKDLNGNVTPSAYYTTVVRTDSTQKPQAVPISIVRTSYNILTANFSRGIQPQAPGSIQINGGSTYYGVVDPDNNKKVNYTISDADASLIGIINVTISGWSSYNVISTDVSAYTPRSFQVNFTTDSTQPILTTYEFDATTSILKLVFTEKVQLAADTGIIVASVRTLADETLYGTNVNYTKLAATESENIIQLKLTNMTSIGTYTFSIEPGFVTDGFKNKNLQKNVTISNTSGSSTELPGPFQVHQSTTNPNEIYVEFANMIDYASAQNINNYKITGVTITSAIVLKNSKENGATVVLTVADGAIDFTVDRPVIITGVMGYGGSYTAITNFTTNVTLKENKRPQYTGISYTYGTIQLRFSEEIKGSMTVKVTVLNTGEEIPCTVNVSGNNVVINPSYTPSNGTSLRIQILSNSITDTSDNAVMPMTSVLSVGVHN